MSENQEMNEEIQKQFNPPVWGQAVDYFFNKVIPKKFLVFVIACLFLAAGKIEGVHWFYISVAYLTGNVIQKFPELSKKTPPKVG
jgi:hypothetical protein